MASSVAFAAPQGVSSAPASQAQAASGAFPFVQASKKALRTVIQPPAITPGAAQQYYGPAPLSASGGYLRRILLGVQSSGGVIGSATLAADSPWNFFAQVRFLQPNNAPILDLTGWNLLLSNCYGGYVGVNDPRNDPDYSTNAGNPNFEPFIPIEIDPTSVGSLSDLSSASGYQLALVYNTAATIWGTQPTTIPSMQVTVDQDYWTLPAETITDPASGRAIPQATAPPNPGTIQLWSNILNLTIASNTRTQLNKMGSQLRAVICVCRAAGPGRSDASMPNPLTFQWDDIIIDQVDLVTFRKVMREYVNGLTARDTGVFTFPYNFGVSRLSGGSGVASYLPTVTATKWELTGPNTASSPTIDFVVNEVSSAPISAVQRTSMGGLRYTPPAPAASGAM